VAWVWASETERVVPMAVPRSAAGRRVRAHACGAAGMAV